MWQYNYNQSMDLAPADDQLEHFGVKGMKWGVRRDAKILASHHYGHASSKAKLDYKAGRISKEKKKQLLKEAKETKKKTEAKVREDMKKATTKEQRKVVENKLKTKVDKEVGYANEKRKIMNRERARMRNNDIIMGTAATVGILASPASAGVLVGIAAAGAAANHGANWVRTHDLDKRIMKNVSGKMLK